MAIITFIIPAFNSQKTITCAINSVLNQTSSDYQIILINDGSTDSTSNICENYQKKYPDKIKYVSQDNRGLGGARNTGLKLVESEYVSFLDSDDWLMPQYVETLVWHIETSKDKKPEIILTLPKIYNENSKLVNDWYDKALFDQIFEQDGQIVNPQLDTRLLRTDVSQCRKVLQLEYARKIHFCFREKVKWEDVYPHFCLMSQCQLCMGIGSIGFYYRKGNDSQITASKGAEWLDLLTVYKDVIRYINNAANILPPDMVKEMYYPVMHIMVSFALEGIRMSDIYTRKHLVEKLHQFFCHLPRIYYSELKKHLKDCTSSEIRNFRILMFLIKHRSTSRFYNSYLYQEGIETAIKKCTRRDRINIWR